MAGQSIVAELAEGDRVQVGIRMILSETLGMVMSFVSLHEHDDNDDVK